MNNPGYLRNRGGGNTGPKHLGLALVDEETELVEARIRDGKKKAEARRGWHFKDAIAFIEEEATDEQLSHLLDLIQARLHSSVLPAPCGPVSLLVKED